MLERFLSVLKLCVYRLFCETYVFQCFSSCKNINTLIQYQSFCLFWVIGDLIFCLLTGQIQEEYLLILDLDFMWSSRGLKL